ncbi:hypothetical protein [Actinomyces polynesiensis]|uniref:hypothetical protein n=1 Tax=Actinomyces polynesiensis TaxID=1325934 RepID=UPI001E4D0F47|nr:hypothetical protein [Actinomyces polynesiensis]
MLFSGDLGRATHPVLRPREVPPGAATVLVESTYGDREHPEPGAEPHRVLAEAIRRTVARGGSVLVPAFAVDRTEVVLTALADMQREGRIPPLPIFVDSPMALASLRIYQSPSAAGELRPEARGFRLPGLDLREVHTVEESKQLNRPHRPCVIISASGMATGGRVLHHLEHMLPDPRHTVVLTGYQAVEPGAGVGRRCHPAEDARGPRGGGRGGRARGGVLRARRRLRPPGLAGRPAPPSATRVLRPR